MTYLNTAGGSPSHLYYVAQPIDLGTISPKLVDQVLSSVQMAERTAYSPKDAFRAGGRPNGVISRINNHAIDQAAAGVAFLVGGVLSIGVPAEIERLRMRRKPVVVVTDLADISWFVGGWAEDPLVRVVQPIEQEIDLAMVWLHAAVDASAKALSAAPAGGQPLIFEPRHPEGEEFTFDVYELPKLPTRGYKDDAGLDLYVSQTVEIQPHQFKDVPTHVAMDIPDGYWVMITGRSSALRRHGLMVSQGVIDAGFTGPLFAGCFNLTNEVVRLERGDRVAQAILLPAPVIGFDPQWGKIRDKERGTNGFGSTGR